MSDERPNLVPLSPKMAGRGLPLPPRILIVSMIVALVAFAVGLQVNPTRVVNLPAPSAAPPSIALRSTVSSAAADAVALANVSSIGPVSVTATTLSTYGAEAGGGSFVAPETLVWAVRLSGSFAGFSCGPYTATPHPCPSPATSALILVDANTGAFIEGRLPAP